MSNLPKLSLRQLFHQSLLDLSTVDGINASSKDEIYGCIFGRDSAITILKILNAHKRNPSLELLEISRRTLLTLTTLQGKKFNINSGEEPGKFIHEFRRNKFEHLINWHIYPDGFLRNYDSIDSTPLTLIALYKYWELTGDKKFLISVMDSVEKGLNWIITFGDRDKDIFLEYDFPVVRKSAGLAVQSWTDSQESLKGTDGQMPKYPIAPVEAQAYGWLALKLWSDYYSINHPRFAKLLAAQAKKLKEKFNSEFLISDNNLIFASQALDGDKRQINTITANPLLALWAAYQKNGKVESIIDEKYISDFVKRVFMDDMFLGDCGIRTMSSNSPTFNPNEDSYHNGSFWPMLNGLVIEGLENFNFKIEAEKLKKASLIPIQYFNSPIELYIKKEGKFLEYKASSGQVGCKVQAWSAAALLDFV